MTQDVSHHSEDWTAPGAYEVAPGVYRIPLPLPNDGLKAVNVYAIMSTDSLVLVDSGWALDEARSALEDALTSLGCELGDVKQFLITHVHRDHYTQAVALRQIYGTPVALGEGERPTLSALANPAFKALTEQSARLRSCGAFEVADHLMALNAGRARSTQLWEMPDAWLYENQTIDLPSRTLKVVNTPGHTQGHVVYSDERHGLLFAGDHVLPHITPSIGFEAAPANLPLASYLASLRLVRSMPDMRLLPAHGPVGSSVHERADEILLHHDVRLASAFEAVTEGVSTAFDVAQRLTWTGRSRPFNSLDPFNQMLAILETAAHLDLLVAQGRLASLLVDEINKFVPSPQEWHVGIC